MKQYLGAIALVVKEYEEAIAFYTGVMGFSLIEDTDLGGGKRWVLVAPSGAVETRILLAKAVTETQQAAVGNQSGGRVFLFLHTDNFTRDYARMKAAGLHFLEEPGRKPMERWRCSKTCTATAGICWSRKRDKIAISLS